MRHNANATGFDPALNTHLGNHLGEQHGTVVYVREEHGVPPQTIGKIHNQLLRGLPPEETDFLADYLRAKA